MNKSELARQIVKKHPGLSKKELGRRLKKNYPTVFKDDDDGRRFVRAVTSSMGKNRALQATNYHKEVLAGKQGKITSDKKVGSFNWRETIPPLQRLQEVFKEAKTSQDNAVWKIDTDEIVVAFIGDLHMGSWATDYDLLKQITDEIINTPNLYVILLGDLLQMAIKLRGVLEVSDNALPPKYQMEFLDSWLKEIKHKVIASTWDNHAVMRQEVATGYSEYAKIFGRHVIYHDNIGHLDVQVGNFTYKMAVAHFFRGRTMYNPTHGQSRYMRMEANDREICAAGDSHVPGVSIFNEGGFKRIALNCGSIQNGGYGKRFFSLLNSPVFPCVKLSGLKKQATPYWSIHEAMQ